MPAQKDLRIKELQTFINAAAWSYHMYRQYNVLYAHSKERLTLLTRVAQVFFADLQMMWHEHILLDMAKLTDPPGKGDKTNLTIIYLVSSIKPALNTSQRTKAEVALAECMRIRSKITGARNRIIAHADSSQAISGEPLGALEDGEIDRFYQQLQIVINILNDNLRDGPYPLDFVAYQGAEDLIKVLAASADKHHKGRIERGGCET